MPAPFCAAGDAGVIPRVIMKKFKALIQNLKSTDSAIRDEAALDLMDIANDKALGPLIEAIRVPENTNYRGTLVYSLSAYNCIEYLDLLVELTVTGSFEVSSNAFNIIEEFELTQAIKENIRVELAKYNVSSLPYEHSGEAYQALSDKS
jgi:HEAT repeat protein